jgi:hypothetical protein
VHEKCATESLLHISVSKQFRQKGYFVVRNGKQFFREVIVSDKAAKCCGLKWKDMKFQKLESKP